ncbi:MAG: hypothetical protein OGM67_12055 [Oscillospiraceae bacterium]|nr:hypothetical protein [Oscillospiraceae bacterium]UYJ34296.1 MAG: hypothetical protein OGM67_12055 [Oscillospiraceae bacterium]
MAQKKAQSTKRQTAEAKTAAAAEKMRFCARSGIMTKQVTHSWWRTSGSK